MRAEEEFRNAEGALAYIRQHDQNACSLAGLAAERLAQVRGNELVARKITRPLDDPRTKDELIRSILALRFPHIETARRMRQGLAA